MTNQSGDVLAGYRVIDHSEFITGPYAAMLLADMGADVVKVERPGRGDPFRSFEEGTYGPQFQAFNRDKRSIQLDLNEERDRATLWELIDSADVYIQNFRPGTIERLGFAISEMMARNPQLVACSISGFGRDGPYANRPAYDTVGQALSGFLSMFVDRDMPRIVGPATADSVTGLYAACGVLGALLARHNTGKGRHVEVAMTSAMAHFSIEQYHRYFVTGVVPNTTDRGRVSQSFAFACGDGALLAVHLSSPIKFWEGFVRAIATPELASDSRFATRMGRVRNHEALEATLRPIFASRSREEWLARLAAEDVPHAPIYDLEHALADPQMRHLDVERTLRHAIHGAVRTMRTPIAFDGERREIVSPPPALDQHGESIRAELAQRERGRKKR